MVKKTLLQWRWTLAGPATFESELENRTLEAQKQRTAFFASEALSFPRMSSPLFFLLLLFWGPLCVPLTRQNRYVFAGVLIPASRSLSGENFCFLAMGQHVVFLGWQLRSFYRILNIFFRFFCLRGIWPWDNML